MNKDFVYKHLKKALTGPTSLEDILALFDPRKIAPQEICEALDGLEKDGHIVKTRTDHYGIPEQMNLLTGRVKKLKKGYGFLVTDNMDMEDLFVPPDSLNSAQNGDRVIVRIMKHRSAAGQGGKNRDECEVVRILERHNKMYVGTYKPKAHYAFVVPDNQTFGQDIIVPFDKTYGAADGDKVLVEITYWGGKGEIPEGRSPVASVRRMRRGSMCSRWSIATTWRRAFRKRRCARPIDWQLSLWKASWSAAAISASTAIS